MADAVTHSREQELDRLRRRAESLAAQRRERPTTAHLLAAIELQQQRGAALLRDQSLTLESLLRGARASSDDASDALAEALRRGRAVAAKMRAPEPSSLHLLVALLSEQGCAAYRALDQSGCDIGRLRVDAFNAALQELGRERVSTRRDQARQRLNGSPRRAVSVPVMPRAALLATPRQSSEAPPAPVPPPPPTATARVGRQPRRPEKLKPSKSTVGGWDERRCPLLSSLGRNLTFAAQRAELGPVVCREHEIQQLLDILARRTGRNPCLVGQAGVGKTSIVHGLAQHIAREVEPGSLDDRWMIELNISKLVADTGVRGALAQRVQTLVKEVQSLRKPVVLVCERLHDWCGAEAPDELASELKALLQASDLCCVATDSREQLQRLTDADPTLAALFTPVEVEEPSREDAFLMLSAQAPRLVGHHGLEFPEAVLALAVNWSSKYLPSRALPEKALGLLDLAGARARRRGCELLPAELLGEIIAEQVNVSLERLLESDGERLLNLERQIASRVIGHEKEIASIARIIRRRAALLHECRPVGTFLLLGPTGVGKTETAKAIAEALYESAQALTRLDMSEYSESHAIARLIGAPPGYVGYESGGQLTESIRRRPHQVLLLDEIEKAHPDVWQAFLSVFDEGRLTDGRGKLVDFSHTVIVLTSNIGAREALASSAARLGFAQTRDAEHDQELAQKIVIREARKLLPPEWFNRIDEVLVYAPLSREQAAAIAGSLLARLAAALFETKRVRLEVERDAVEYLLDAGGFSFELGARPIKRIIAQQVESQLAEMLLSGAINPGSCVSVRLRSQQLEFVVDETDR